MDAQEQGTLSFELQSRVESELKPGETIRWIGQPLAWRLARVGWGIVLFGIPWTAFAVFWTAGAAWGVAQANQPWFFSLFPLFGVPFILIGIGLLSSPYWARRKAHRTVYAVTDRRALSIEGGIWNSYTVRSFTPERMVDMKRTQHSDGSGDLLFAPEIRTDSDGDRATAEVGFHAIPRVKDVELLIKQLIEEHSAPA